MNLRSLPNTYVICPDQVWVDDSFQSHYAIVVEDQHFQWVGRRQDLPEEYQHIAKLELAESAIVPGMIDCHQHLAQTLGRPYAFGEPSEIFRRVWVPLESALTEEELALSARLGLVDALLGGFTSVADAGARSAHDPEIIAEQAREIGVRLVLGKISHDVIPSDGDESRERASKVAEEVISAADEHVARYSKDPWVYGSVAVAVPEMATPPTLSALADVCWKHDAVLQTHVNEHLVGVERCLVGMGQRPMSLLENAGALNRQLLAAHATLLTSEEKVRLAQSGAAWSYNPVASAWKGNVIADASGLIALGARTGLGTDGTRSDAFRLMDAAETAQRFASAMEVGDPIAGGGKRWLSAATSGGADAVGLGGIVGEIKAGFAADFLVLRLNTPDFICSVDLAWELVRLGHRDQIHAVVTAGQARVVDGEFLDVDYEQLIAAAREASASACDRAGLRERRACP